MLRKEKFNEFFQEMQGELDKIEKYDQNKSKIDNWFLVGIIFSFLSIFASPIIRNYFVYFGD